MRVNIEAERVRNRLTKEELSAKIGISLKTYYNWINENTDIPGSGLLKLANVLNKNIEYLLESDLGAEHFDKEVG